MSRFSKHLGKGTVMKIEDEEFIIKPLSTEEAPLFLSLMKLSNQDGSFDMSKMSDETSNIFKKLLNTTLKKSFPEEWKTDEEELKTFGLKYMMPLFNAIIEVNQPPGDGREDKVAELKERLNNK